jgi:undecaprenyl-phosphate 4-deoxy-4-formamido-L-arabinose transferase
MLLSFTIPCYRSEHTVESVINEIIAKVREKEEYDYEIIAVNDCSPDNVWSVLKRLSIENEKIKAINLSINGGKHAALMAAFSIVQGDIIIGVDDDGQCPIDHLWELIEPLNRGYDMAIAQYPKKKQSFIKNLGSKVNDAMVRYLLEKPKGMIFSNFIARKKFVCEEIRKYTNPYPYLEGLTLRTTRNIAMVPMEERERQSGTSGYTLIKSIKLWVNGCTAFSVKPLRFAILLGVIFSLFGFTFGLYIVIEKLLSPSMAAGYASTMAILLFIGGVIMMSLGIIGEYIGRIYICINNSPQYVIREVINLEDKE